MRRVRRVIFGISNESSTKGRTLFFLGCESASVRAAVADDGNAIDYSTSKETSAERCTWNAFGERASTLRRRKISRRRFLTRHRPDAREFINKSWMNALGDESRPKITRFRWFLRAPLLASLAIRPCPRIKEPTPLSIVVVLYSSWINAWNTMA